MPFASGMDTAPQTRAAIAAFRQGAEAVFGSRLDSILLFGSRSRDDYTDESDLDLAVILKDEPADPLEAADRIMDIAFVPTMEAGRIVQPFVWSMRTLRTSQHPLIRTVREQGVPV